MDPLYAELDRRAARDGLRGRVRVAQRWTGSPMRAVAAELPERGEILDLGCGFGLFDAVLALAAPGRRVTGRDVDEGKVARARRLFGDLAAFEVKGVGEEEDAAWDAVVFYDVLHHLDDADAALRSAARALRPGGRLVVKENDVRPLWKHGISLAVEWVATRSELTRSAPVRFRTPEAWGKAVQAAGLRLLRCGHLPAREGFFVPHALIVAERPGAA